MWLQVCGSGSVVLTTLWSAADRGPEALQSGGAGLLVPGAQKHEQQEAQRPCECVHVH